MKNFTIIVLAFVSVSFSACRKDHSCSDTVNNEKISIAGATIVKTGAFTFTNKLSSGTSTIYQQKNGTYILAFEQMQFSSAVDVDVKLAKADTDNNSIKLFSVKNVTDHLYFEIPSSININAFNYLFLQSDISDTPVGTAWLK